MLRLSVASQRATRVEAWVYADPRGSEVLTRELVREGDVFTTRIPRDELEAAGVTTVYYGYRVWGPNWPFDAAWRPGTTTGHVADVDAEGNRMNPNKLLIDPYAREISHDPFGHSDADVDSAADAPKSIALPPPTAADVDLAGRPDRPLSEDVIYEVHLRGLTKGDAAAGPCAGTYAGAATRAADLAALGVTAIELLPIQETWNDGNDRDPDSPDGDNYWGYSTIAFLAPDRRYACDQTPGGPTRELRAMVRTFHEHGLKVFLDVVYNHTAEGSGGALLSMRGIDNAGYYELTGDGRRFVDHNGVGADVATRKPLAGALVIDSLRYLADGIGVDGFRFDLAAVLGNTCANGCFSFDPQGFPAQIAREVPGVALIAEAWGIGDGTYQVGNFPAGWAEWNGPYRDTVRDDQNRDGLATVTPGWLSDKVAGSSSLFGDDGRGPAGSVNFLTAHDGMTLRDLYACNGKNNGQPWPWGPSDGGTDDDRAWDHGGDPAAQRQATRTGMALLMFSAGTPMITGGDEALRTQRCNNNVYNLDSPAMWLDWDDSPEEAAFRTFTTRVIALRRRTPQLAWATSWQPGQVSWHRGDGSEADGAFMDDAGLDFLGWRLGAEPAATIYVAYNGGPADLEIGLPAAPDGTRWHVAVDTASGETFAAGEERAVDGDRLTIAARALIAFVAR